MIICDLCGQNKPCTQKEIEGKEYDFCSDCWKPVAAKLKGKGRTKKYWDPVIASPPENDPEPTPLPGAPPVIIGRFG